MDQSAPEYMLYHQKSFAQVKLGSASRNESQIFFPATRWLDCFQNWTSASSRLYQPLPTMPCSAGRATGQVIRLRRAGDGRKRRRDADQRAALPKGIDARGIRAEQRLGQADHVNDRGACHALGADCDLTRA